MIDLGSAGATARRTARVGALFAVAGASAYGVNIVAARLAAQLGLSGPDIVVYRSLAFLPLALAILLITGRRVTLTAAERPDVLRFAVFSAGVGLAYISSLKFLPVAMAVTIFYTYPLLVILISPRIDGIRLSPRRWIVAIAAFAGVMLAVGPHAEALDPRGVALALLGALLCAGMFISGARLTTDGMQTFFWSQMVAAPTALAFAWASGGLAPPEALLAAALPFAITAGGFFIGLLFQILATSRLSAASAGLLFLIEPVVAIVAAAIALGEHLTPAQAAGMLIVLGALASDFLPGLAGPSRSGGAGA